MNTGGPAFPGTLLDWMAGQALASRGMYGANVREKEVAKECYDLASAMLAEKARREADHSGDANKMVEDHFRDAAKMTKLEARNRELEVKIAALESYVERLTLEGNSMASWISNSRNLGQCNSMASWLSNSRNLGQCNSMAIDWKTAKEAKP